MRARPGGVGIFDGFFGVQELGRAHREATKVEWPQPSSQLQVQKLREAWMATAKLSSPGAEAKGGWMAAAEPSTPAAKAKGGLDGRSRARGP